MKFAFLFVILVSLCENSTLTSPKSTAPEENKNKNFHLQHRKRSSAQGNEISLTENIDLYPRLCIGKAIESFKYNLSRGIFDSITRKVSLTGSLSNIYNIQVLSGSINSTKVDIVPDCDSESSYSQYLCIVIYFQPLKVSESLLINLTFSYLFQYTLSNKFEWLFLVPEQFPPIQKINSKVVIHGGKKNIASIGLSTSQSSKIVREKHSTVFYSKFRNVDSKQAIVIPNLESKCISSQSINKVVTLPLIVVWTAVCLFAVASLYSFCLTEKRNKSNFLQFKDLVVFQNCDDIQDEQQPMHTEFSNIE